MLAALAVSGCRRSADTERFRFAFRAYFREHHVSTHEVETGFSSIHVFFCDVDGDGVEEAFAASHEDWERWGTSWHAFRYQNGSWLEMDTGLDRYNHLYSYASRFYYRDDTQQQPRVFIDTCIRDSPMAVVMTKDNKIVSVPFDRRDYEELRAEGRLKPVESLFYNWDDSVMIARGDTTGIIKGDNEPISPYDCYGDKEFINEQSAVHGTFQKLYQSAMERCSNSDALCVFTFDVDGDWLDERFVTCDAMASDLGSEWHVFCGQHEEWTELRIADATNRLCAPVSRFYYRDDVRDEPRLFIDTCVTNSPMAITLDWDKSVLITPFDRQAYEDLREQGILKPVRGWWYNTRYGLDIRTITGTNNPIGPDDRFPYEDASPGLDRTAYFDHRFNSGEIQNLILAGDAGQARITETLSEKFPFVPGIKYLFAVFASDDGLSLPPEKLIPLEWNLSFPDGQTLSGNTTVYSLQRIWFTVVRDGILDEVRKDFPGHLLGHCVVTVPNDDVEQPVQTEQDMQAVFVRAVHKYLARNSITGVPDRLSHVIFFDVDKDGISDEALFTTVSSTSRNWWDWRAFCYKDRLWQQPKNPRAVSGFFPWDFYYRTDMKHEPCLFVRKYLEGKPVSFSRSDWGWGYRNLDREEFDNLLRSGELQRVTWYCCGDDGSLHLGEYEEDAAYGELGTAED